MKKKKNKKITNSITWSHKAGSGVDINSLVLYLSDLFDGMAEVFEFSNVKGGKKQKAVIIKILF